MSLNNPWSMAIAILALLALAAAQPLWAQSSKYREGVHYFKIDQASPQASDGTVEVMEVFSYLCSHCNSFEPFISGWLERKPENVKFVRVPVIFGRRTWELYARAYVTAEMMGIADKAHAGMMDALWKQRSVMRTMEEIGEFYSDFGVSAQDFVSTSNSFAVDARMRRDQTMTQSFGVNGTPTMIVNRKYLVRGNEAVPNYDAMLDVVDSLVAQETVVVDEAGAEAEPAVESG